jgi:hypothetical protein
MNISFLTTEDPLYLPMFFELVLPVLARRHAVRVFSVPPLYKNQSSAQAARRYLATFGTAATVQLAMRLLQAKIAGQSIRLVCRREGVAHEVVSEPSAPRRGRAAGFSELPADFRARAD